MSRHATIRIFGHILCRIHMSRALVKDGRRVTVRWYRNVLVSLLVIRDSLE